MFKAEKRKMRRELALFFMECFKNHLLVPGMPLNEQTFGALARTALIMADGFENMEALSKEDLLAWGQPQSPMRMPPKPPAQVVQMPPAPTPQAS